MGDVGQAFSDSLQGLSSAFSGGGAGVNPATGGLDLGTAVQALAAAPAATAATPSQTIDPTGSIGAQLSITPPGSGTDPVGSVGGTQGGAPQSTSSAGQGGGQRSDQSQPQAPPSSSAQLRKILQMIAGAGQTANPYVLGTGARAAVPGEGASYQPEYGPGPPEQGPPNPGSREGESVQPEYGPGLPERQGPPNPGSREGESVQPEYGPAQVFSPPSQQPAPAPGLGGLARALLPKAAFPLSAAGAYFGSTSPADAHELSGAQAPSGAGLAPPGTGQGSYPQSTAYPQGGPAAVERVVQGLDQETGGTAGEMPTGRAPPPDQYTYDYLHMPADEFARKYGQQKPPPPTDPKTSLPADPKTGKPLTPDQYKKWFDQQTKGKPADKKSADPALEPTKKAPPTKTPPTRKEGPPRQPPPGGPPPGMGGGGLGAILGPLMRSGLPQLAMMALMSGMGGRRHHGGGHWRGGRGSNMGHFHPHFYRHDRDEGGGMNPALLSALMGGGGQQGQQGAPQGQGRPQIYQNPQGPQGQGGGGAALSPDNPFIAATIDLEDGGRNIVSQTDPDDSGRTIAQGGNPDQIPQGYFQIRPSTWRAYAAQAGVDPNILPMKADYATQLKVASVIPIGQWGDRTKNALIQRFGWFDPKTPFGQVAARFGGTQLAQPSKTYLPPMPETPHDASGGQVASNASPYSP